MKLSITSRHGDTQLRRALLLLWLATAILLGLAWWHVLALVSDSRAKELASVERDLANLTRVSQEHADRTFRSADQVIRFIQARYLEIGDRLDLAALSAQGVIDTEIFNQVGIIDAHGIYVLSNLPIKGRLDLSDREHFKVHVAADSGELFVSKPVLGRASGKWSVQLTRRISRANGDFAGVVVVSINPGYFTGFYSELQLGSKGVMALYGLDGVARARRIGIKEEFGSEAANSPMFARIAQGQLTGVFSNPSVVDGVERLYHYRKLPNYRLVVLHGLDLQYLLVNQQRAAQALWLQAVILSLLLLAFSAVLTRYLQRINQNLLARQAAQRQIEEHNDQLTAIFSMSPDAFVSFDASHHITYVSPTFLPLMARANVRLEGMSEQDFSAWLLQHCEPGSSFAGIAAMRAQTTQGQSERPTLIEIANPGKRILQLSLRSSESSAVSQLLHFREVTRETEIDQMKSEFLSTAAHELRTPMASICGFTEVLMTQQLTAEESSEFLNIIHTRAQLMSNILNELLDLARIEARRGKDFVYARLDLAGLVKQSVASFIPPTGSEAPELQLPRQAVWIMADGQKLQQAILNVLSNAYKYSAPGKPVKLQLTLETPTPEPWRVCLCFTDQGIGMTPEQVERVCERFYRADASGKVPGTGLGMSIVKEIINLHGGSLTIQSQFGQGSRVSFSLPVIDEKNIR
jgi:signal transduction histidine kinase